MVFLRRLGPSEAIRAKKLEGGTPQSSSEGGTPRGVEGGTANNFFRKNRYSGGYYIKPLNEKLSSENKTIYLSGDVNFDLLSASSHTEISLIL